MFAAALTAVCLAQASPRILVVDSLVIAEHKNGAWTSYPDEGKPVKASVTLNGFGIGTAGSSMKADGWTQEDFPGYFINNSDGTRNGVFVSGFTPKFPRKVTVLDPKNATYQKIVNDYLTGVRRGLKASIQRLLSVDLDGNGSAEIVIQAASRPELEYNPQKPSASDCSVVIVRQVAAGKVATLGLYVDHSGTVKDMYISNRLRAIADIDGDGVMEIVASSGYYEGDMSGLFRLKGGKLTKLAQVGSGV